MNVVVTGAAGFVGRHLVSTLVTSGVSVRRVVRRPDHCADAKTYVADLQTMRDWSPILDGADVVLHLAARVHVLNTKASSDLEAFRQVNVTGTGRLFDAAVRSGVRGFVYLSSVKVHGEESGERGFDEADVPRPEDAYGRSKLEAEMLLNERSAGGETTLTILRPPLVYGPGVGANFLALMRVVDRGVPLPLGSVMNRRSFISVRNLVDALVFCTGRESCAAATFGVSDCEDVSTPELIRRVATALNRPARLVRVPPALLMSAARLVRQGASVRRLLGSLAVRTTRIQAAGWSPVERMSDALTTTAQWYRTGSYR